MSGTEERQRELYNRMVQTENECRKQGFRLIAGADEAGRGPLAGPVVAACVLFPADVCILGINDSKKLSETKREQLYEQIVQYALCFKTGIIMQHTIDELNILRATRLAFKEAIESMEVVPDYIYTDAIDKLDITLPWKPIIKGDATIYSIAAASIVAKVTRDRMMREYDQDYPEYGFAQHKGYGTAAHYDAIRKYGITPLHRRSFLKNMTGAIEWNE